MQQSNLYKKNKNKSIVTYVLIGVVVVLVVAIVWYFGFAGRGDEAEEEAVNVENINGGFTDQEVSADIDYMRGTIGLKSGDEAWKIIAEEVVLAEGDSLKTADASRAVVTVGSPAEMRMDGNTEVTFKSLQSEALEIEQARGSTYHNGAQLLDSYLVAAPGAEIKPEGAAFAVVVDEESGEVTVYAVSGDVEVNNATIAEGYKMTVEGGETQGVEEITDEEYDSEWWTWNASRDEGEESDDSDLDGNDNENENENTNEADEEEEEEELEDEEADENTNEDENTNAEEEEEEPEPEPTSSAPSGSSITGLSSGSSGVSVSWSKSGGENFKYYRVVRSESNSNPTYPSDGYVFYTGNANEVSFTDSNAESGTTYYYNVCVVDVNDNVTCGSAQSVTVK